jgi:hypothetical protein
VRLDRGVANEAFADMFAECQLENLITTSSDHYAIWIKLDDSSRMRLPPSLQVGFRYEAM